MSLPHPVTAVVVHFRTPDLLRRAVSSIRTHYPDLPLLLIDNGSGDQSPDLLRGLQTESPETTGIILNDRNLHHGPAMDQALHRVTTPYVFFLDSDAELTRGGILEAMFSAAAQDTRHYAVGKKIFMNKRGFDVSDRPGATPYIRPICMLIHRERYFLLPPFERHGAPCLRNMKAAISAGYSLISFPVDEYMHHRGRGTAGTHGYRLGIRGKLNHLLNRLGL